MRGVLALVSALVLVSLAPAAGAADLGAVSVTLSPGTSNVTLGEKLPLEITVTNRGPASTPPLVVHLDVTDPDRSTSVDPEDWTSTLSKRVAPLAPGASAKVGWTVQPISRGTFAAYAVVLSSGVDNVAVSDVLHVDVTGRRALNPGGILFVSLGVPASILALLLLQLARARRTTDVAA
jgi:hypothetical protein